MFWLKRKGFFKKTKYTYIKLAMFFVEKKVCQATEEDDV